MSDHSQGSAHSPGSGEDFGPAARLRLAEVIAEDVIGTPGVLRLEPTVGSAIAGLRKAAGAVLRGGTASLRTVDGVVVTENEGRLTISVDLATDWDHPAVDVAIAVRQRVLVLIADAGLPRSRVDVRVLTIGDV